MLDSESASGDDRTREPEHVSDNDLDGDDLFGEVSDDSADEGMKDSAPIASEDLGGEPAADPEVLEYEAPISKLQLFTNSDPAEKLLVQNRQAPYLSALATEDEVVRNEMLESTGQKNAFNTIRWRYTQKDEGALCVESNSRLVKWSDGSYTLYVGNEPYLFPVSNGKEDNRYLFSHDKQTPDVMVSSGTVDSESHIVPVNNYIYKNKVKARAAQLSRFRNAAKLGGSNDRSFSVKQHAIMENPARRQKLLDDKYAEEMRRSMLQDKTEEKYSKPARHRRAAPSSRHSRTYESSGFDAMDELEDSDIEQDLLDLVDTSERSSRRGPHSEFDESRLLAAKSGTQTSVPAEPENDDAVDMVEDEDDDAEELDFATSRRSKAKVLLDDDE